MTPRIRQAALTAHIVFSVGWLGAVLAFLALSLAGLMSQNVEVVRGAYLAMDLLGRWVILPASAFALASGLLQAWGTEWGLFRHYWIVTKLVLTFGSVSLLVLHQFVAVGRAAALVVASPSPAWPEIGRLGPQLAKDAALAAATLVIVTAISVFKPWGRTGFGRQAPHRRDHSPPSTHAAAPNHGPTPFRRGRRRLVLALAGVAIVVMLIALHGKSQGMHGH